MYYTQLYTGLFKGVMGVKLVMVLYSAFDTITLIANTWCHNIFTVEKIQGDVIKCRPSIGGSQLAYRLAYRGTGTKWKRACEIWQTCHRIGLPNPNRRIRQGIRTDKHKEYALFLPDVQ